MTNQPQTQPVKTKRLQINVEGAVQGVGFRPFVYRLADQLSLSGWVINDARGCLIEVEGDQPGLDLFLQRLSDDAPPYAKILSINHEEIVALGETSFDIRHSEGGGEASVLMLPDLAVCDDCQRELFDPSDRRYRYPFINCTNCGPRFSIINGLPYDRATTTMRAFVMCALCQAEYDDPGDRRFHAQPNACPACGPQVELWNQAGAYISSADAAIQQTVVNLQEGQIVAVKGLGGFHLMVDAGNEDAVRRLRERKRREQKPLAVMAPSLAAVSLICHVSEREEQLLCSYEAPIVLLRKKHEAGLSQSLAPGNPCLGVMLPYTPLHHLILHDVGAPLVATSGNLTDEPICTDEREAAQRLGGIADCFLVHDRPITRYVDDSVVRMIAGEAVFYRRARGYAPLPLSYANASKTVIALGAHLKNTVSINRGGHVFVSQHIGDVETEAAHQAFTEIAGTFQRVYNLAPDEAACDLHPDYLSSRYAESLDLPLTQVQHHYAHAAACMAENELDGTVLAFSWDGTGLGPDGTVWGGECLLCDWQGFQRAAHLRTFALPSGEKAVKEPRRAALGLLYELWGDRLFESKIELLNSFNQTELNMLKQTLAKSIHCPRTSSMGRLFDGVSSLLNLRQSVSFEGQGAMELEWAIGDCQTNERFPFKINTSAPAEWLDVDGAPSPRGGPRPTMVLDWGPMIETAAQALKDGMTVAECATRFHNTLIEMAVAVAHDVKEPHVVLTGGCFQNAYLTERALARLKEEGFTVYRHLKLPPNDGSISFGQLAAAHHRRRREPCV